MCSYCQSFDHCENSCLYYDVFNELYARLNAIIKTMNEQYKHFVSEMRKFDPLYLIDPSIFFSRFEASLYNDYEFFLFLESNFVDDASSIDLE